VRAQCIYCIKKTKDFINTNITKKYKNNKNIKKITYDNIFVIKDHKHKQYKTISKTIKTNTKNEKPEVILDSGPSKTYFNDRKRLSNFQYERSKVMVGNETTLT
jgi:hypothetical protein